MPLLQPPLIDTVVVLVFRPPRLVVTAKNPLQHVTGYAVDIGPCKIPSADRLCQNATHFYVVILFTLIRSCATKVRPHSRRLVSFAVRKTKDRVDTSQKVSRTLGIG